MDDRGERGHAGHTPCESCRDRHRSYGGQTQDQPSTGCGEEDADGGTGAYFRPPGWRSSAAQTALATSAIHTTNFQPACGVTVEARANLFALG